ncbi:MAG: peptidoglycan-binding protein [Hyphomicrobiales bacterium]
MTRRDLVHRVAQLLARGRREEPATLRGAADVIARASEGDEVARLFVREAVAMAETSPHVVKLLDDAARTMAALKASLAQSESTGHEVRGARELPSVKTARDVQMALFVLGYRGPGGAPITFDGRPGPATSHALRHFQHVHKLPADGLPSPVILRELEWSLYTAGWDSEVFPARVSEVPTEQTGYSDPGHAYGPRPPPLHVQHAPAPYYPESYAFPWHGRAYAEVPTSPRQIGDPLYASARTPWMGAQGYGAQYITHDQDETDFVPSPSYRWHWLERDEPEGERC